jgi:hypothetical protein
VLGPDGALYIGFKAAGDIVKVVSPLTEPLPCSNVSTVAFSGDQRKSFGLAWIGHDLYSGDGFSPFVITGADACKSSAPCRGASILAGTIPAPSAVISDQVYPATNGTSIYFGNANAVTRFAVVPSQAITTAGTGFNFIFGLVVDPANPAKVFVGDDPTDGFNVGQGHWWSLP